MDSPRDLWRQVNEEVRAELARVRTRYMLVDGIDATSGMVRLADLDGEVWLELVPSLSAEPLGAGDAVLVGMLPPVGDRKARGSRFVLGKIARAAAAGIAATTIANTTTQTVFASPAKSFAPGYLAVAGRSFRVFGRGRWGLTAFPTLTIRIQLFDGSTATDLAVFVLTPPGAVTDRPFRFEVVVQFVSTTQCRSSGEMVYDNGTTNVVALHDSALLTPGTASALSLRVTGQWSAANAANTVTLGNGLVEVVT